MSLNSARCLQSTVGEKRKVAIKSGRLLNFKFLSAYMSLQYLFIKSINGKKRNSRVKQKEKKSTLYCPHSCKHCKPSVYTIVLPPVFALAFYSRDEYNKQLSTAFSLAFNYCNVPLKLQKLAFPRPQISIFSWGSRSPSTYI